MNNLPAKNQSEMLVALPKQDQAKVILGIITRAVMIAGTRPTEDEVAIIVSETLNLVNTRYKSLSIQEVSDIIRAGVIGDYEDSYLCVRNINTWLRGYLIDRTKKEEREAKEREDKERIPMVVKADFLMSNLDKMPTLKNYLLNIETKRK